MRAMRLGVAVAATAVATLAMPASAHLTRPAALGGVTTVVADHSATARVVLYDDATVSVRPTDNPDTAIAGKGRFVGVWLTRDDGYNTSWYGEDQLGVYRLPAFGGRITRTVGSTYPRGECTSWPNDIAPLEDRCDYPKAKGILLHQGYYRLTIVTDGAPVRVTLRLHGATGHRTIRPATPVHTAEAWLKERDGFGDDMVTFGRAQENFGRATTLLQFADAEFSGDPHMWGTSACVRYDDGSSAGPMAYGPTCPGGAGGGGWYRMHVGPQDTGGMWVWGSASDGSESGPLGQGGSFWSDQGVTFHRALGVWIQDPCICWAW